MKIASVALAFTLLALSGGAARAETLDEKAIRDFYAMQTSIARDTLRTQAFLEERLDTSYSLESTSVTTVAGNPPQNAQTVSDKATTIGDMVKARNYMNIQDYKNDVKAVTLSPDKKTATVDDIASSSGTMDVPLENSQRVTVHYDVSNNCKDTLSLVNSKITYTHSVCDTKVDFTR